MPFSASGEAHSNASQPDYWHPHYRLIQPTLEYLKDMWVGKRRWIGDDGKILDPVKSYYYLPKAEAQEDDQYLKQVRDALFIRYFRSAIEQDFAGLLVDYDLENDEVLEGAIDNIDMAGNSLKIFLKMVVSYALRDGSCFVLVDKANSKGKSKTMADFPDRPYFVLFERDQVVNWQHEIGPNGLELSMVVLRQDVYKPDGEFGVKQFETYRVYKKDGSYDVYECEKSEKKKGAGALGGGDKGGEDLKKVESGKHELGGIPLVGVSLTSDDPFTADPPLIDLADLNLKSYRIGSTLDCTIGAMVPTLHANEFQNFAMDETGKKKNLVIGPNAVQWNLERLQWVEASGAGVQPMERFLARIVEQIEKMTVSFFTGGTVAKTATEVELDAAQAESALTGYALHLESAVEVLFEYWFRYLGQSTEDKEKLPRIVVNKSLVKPPTAWTVADISNMIATGQMTLELGYRIMQELNLLPESIEQSDIEEEISKITGSQEEAKARASELEQRKLEVAQTEMQNKIQMQQQKMESEAQRYQMELQREQMKTEREMKKAQDGNSNG